MKALVIAALLIVGVAGATGAGDGPAEAGSAAPPDPAAPLRPVRFGPLYEFIWASGIGPRVGEPALMLIDPYPWSAPLEDVRLKAR